MPRSRQSPSSPSPSKEDSDGIDDLSFHQARTALELILAELQRGDLEVEAMADLYRRAQRYADRCETVLRDVEQEVRRWDPQNPEMAPEPFSR
jgi:exodeoxyribonuclease VII small subunit